MKGFEWFVIYVIILLDVELPIRRTKHGVGKERYHDMYQISGSRMMYLFELRFANRCLRMALSIIILFLRL